MARPKKQNVDYFPHFCKGGRTIFILENMFGNDGYAFWFKILEILGDSDGHFYDCSNASSWTYLLARTHTDEELANKIMGVLINLGKIDAELWTKHRIIWVENFVRNLTEFYRRREENLPNKPVFEDIKEEVNTVSDSDNIPNDELMPSETPKVKETKVKETKVKETKVKETKVNYPYQGICDLWNEICISLPKVQKINSKRKDKIKSRCEEWGKTEEEWMETASEIFRHMQASDFLTGRSTTKREWTANFDWAFENDSNWVKVLEGNYDNKEARSPQKGASSTKIQLGVGEFLDDSGRRTYGTGKATIPPTAPPRPSDKHAWDAQSNNWILL